MVSRTLYGGFSFGKAMSFWQAKTKLRRSDILFSQYIRRRDGWKCTYRVKCLAAGNINYEDNKGALTNSHYQKRRHESTRFDPLNCDAACRACHQWVEDTAEGKEWLKQWKTNQLGEREHTLLLVRAQTYQEKDEKMAILYCRQLLKELDKK